MAIKYQVFVSSTYGDLKEERDRVIQGILEMGHIPVGMEMFSAADEAQWKIIARHIDESDYYVVVLAHRYGSVVDGISYTRKEYEYALAKGVPVIGFIIDPTVPWPADRVDTDPTAVRKLKDFRHLVEQKPVGYWTSADDLYGKATVALVKAIAATPRTGWVRASSALGPEVTAEISRLSSENAHLRRDLAEALKESERESELALDKVLATLESNTPDYSIRLIGERGWQDAHCLNMEVLFRALSPLMLVEAPTEQLSRIIAINSLNAEQTAAGKRAEMIPANEMGEILSDFMALDLMRPSEKRHPVADTKEYWTLTEQGQALTKRISRKRLETADIEDLVEDVANSEDSA